MKNTVLALVSSSLIFAAPLIQADTLSINQLQAKLAELESKISQQPTAGNFINKLTVSGLMEVQASNKQAFDNSENDTSNASLATFELSMEALVNANIHASATFIYEEGDTPFEMDTANIHFTNHQNIRASVGQTYLPFGSFYSQQINDTLALEIAESRNTAIMLGFIKSGFNADVYVFANAEGKLNQSGLHLAYSTSAFTVDADYINNILNSNSFNALIEESTPTYFITKQDATSAISWHVTTKVAGIALNAEYLALAKLSDESHELKITASQVEAAYHFTSTTVALAYQQTQDAALLGLPEQRLSASAAFDVLSNTTLAVEIWHDEDYDISHAGSGNSSDNFVIQAAVEF